MIGRSLLSAVAVALVAAGCGDDGRTLEPAPPTTATVPAAVPSTATSAELMVQIQPPHLHDDGTLDPAVTCDGTAEAPVFLTLGGPPVATERALAVVDVDAGGAVHLVVAGIPSGVDVVDPAALLDGAVVGTSSGGALGWEPPCPPAGSGAHRYEVRLYALAEPSGLAAGVDGRSAVEALEAAALERDVLTASYGR